MRLLQLATGPGELIDLHPNVTVVAGLDRTGRELLADAVAGLAAGRASGPRGLLEAHGVLFDLAPEALALLDIAADGVEPVVTTHDLPATRPASAPAPPPSPTDLDARWTAAQERDRVAQAALVAAAAAVARAREAASHAPPVGPADAAPDEAEATERRDRLSARVDELDDELAAAKASRAALEASTVEVRARSDAAGAERAATAARLETARRERDPDAAMELERAANDLADLEAEIDTARQVDDQPQGSDDGPPDLRVARLDAEIEATEKRLAAFGPADVDRVRSRLEPLRSVDGRAVAPLAEAIALADELEALEAELVATEAVGGTPGGGLAEGRVRLDEARQALLEAEQAARRPDLDRDTVERLEQVHAELLDAIDKAGGRFAGARAQRRVDALRADESAILDELDLTSYSDYLMGSSLLHVDPVKEAALDAARAELSAAEDAWQLLSSEAETELVRAERMEHRRGRIDEARRLLGRPVPSGALVAELRELRVGAEPPPAMLDDLRAALDQAGVAVGDEDLDREELVLLAEAWLAEVDDAAAREAALRDDLTRLQDERSAARAAVDAAVLPPATPAEPVSDEAHDERLAAARDRVAEAEDRHLAHLAVEREVATLAEELAEAEAAERVARDDAAQADAAIAAAVAAEDAAAAAHARAAEELADAQAALAAGPARTAPEDDGRREAASLLAAAEAVHAGAVARAGEAATLLASLEEERRAAAAAPLAEASEEAAPVLASEEIEWYLLARLAAQRSLSLGGSLPLLLDDALTGLGDADIDHVLGRLERMADAVQVIVVSDDPAVASWAGRAGADRAAVVRPEASSTV
jgi:hypothetical protein